MKKSNISSTRNEFWRLKRCAGFSVACLLVFSVLGVGSSSAAGHRKPARLLFGHGFQEKHPVHKGLKHFQNLVAGIVKVEIKTGMEDDDAVRSLVTQNLSGAVVMPSSLRNIARGLTILDLVGLWRDRGHWEKFLEGETGHQFARLVERATSGRILVLGFWGGTQRHLQTRSGPISDVKKLANIRLSVPLSPVQSKTWKMIGVKRVFLRRSEYRDALRDGTVEGIDVDVETILRERLYEAAPYLTETGHAIATRVFIFNGEVLNRFSESERRKILAAADEATSRSRELEVKREMEMISMLRDRYRVRVSEFRDLKSFRTATRPIRERYSREVGAEKLLEIIEKTGQ